MDQPTPRPAPFRVMLSSTFRDLEAHRDAVLAAMPSYDLLPLAMEYDAALPSDDLISASLKKVERSDAYVGIIGYRYGQIPASPEHNPRKLSLTEMEFRHAVELKKPICMFLMSTKHLVPAGESQGEGRTKTKLAAFRKLAAKGRIYAEFISVEDLRAKAELSLHELQKVLNGADTTAAPAPPQPYPIRKAPEFYAVADYIPGHLFVGRTKELLSLDDWAGTDKPVLLFEAIGGMGKSMLTWHWVRSHVMKSRAGWAGRFWYSFYERGADMGDFCAYALAYTTGRPLKEFRGRKTTALTPELLDVLRGKPWLFVLDGLERILVAYNRLDAAQAGDEEVNQDPDRAGRHPEACIRPADEELLRLLSVVQPSKMLITSRLMPRALLNRSGRPLPGVRHIDLQGLDPADAERLMREAGVRGDSARMQQHVERHFAGHPLVVGVVAGLVARFRAAPGDFDRWADDPQGGASVDLALMDLVQRRNHILKAAFDDLTSEERVLMVRLGMVSDSVDLGTVEALNPFRPEPPEAVKGPMPPERRRSWELRELERQLDEVEGDSRPPIQQRIDELRAQEMARYEQEKAAHQEYLRLLENWQKSPELKNAGDRLRQALDDLETRGVLNWDRVRNQYDLHPVVRNYAVHCLPLPERAQIGRKVVDHFTSRPDPPYEAAETMADVRNGLQVARSLLQIGDLERAFDVIEGGLSTALWFNLERYNDYLALLRPYFPHGWTKPPEGLVVKSDLGVLATNASAALSSLGRTREALAIDQYAIPDAVREKGTIYVDLTNHCTHLTDADRMESAERVLSLAEQVVALYDEESRACVLLRRFDHLLCIGRTTEAEAAWERFNSVPRPTTRLYRPGDAEWRLVALRFRENRLDEELLMVALGAAKEGKNRRAIRLLDSWRGEWLLSIGRFAESESAFEESIATARDSGLVSPSAEARRSLAQAKQGKIDQARETAERIALLEDPPAISLAELFLALGDRTKALEYVTRGYPQAWGDGMPYVDWWGLQRCRAVYEALGEPEPQLPPFDPSKATPLPFEAEVRALIEELKAKKKAEAPDSSEAAETT